MRLLIVAGTRVRSGQSQIRPADGSFFKLLPVFFCFGNLRLLACL